MGSTRPLPLGFAAIFPLAPDIDVERWRYLHSNCANRLRFRSKQNLISNAEYDIPSGARNSGGTILTFSNAVPEEFVEWQLPVNSFKL